MPRFQGFHLSAASWNDDNPFPSRERTPRYEQAKDDPNKGTVDEKRRGPFPIGIAVETTTPAAWYEASPDASAPGGHEKPTSIRIAAIGHGGVFVGNELSPAKETLLLNTCNWLLGRDDRLPRAEPVWQYPRVALSVVDSNNAHRGVTVRGVIVERLAGDQGGTAHIHKMAKKYRGVDQYPNLGNQVRVLMRIKPTHVIERNI